ncbi:MAG: hypothetical protein MJ016_00865 [Victivallaceae bacterium]|nr:hypothetical protein [Victivallaceae bacterium]
MEKPIIVLAVGGAGCRILAEMQKMPEAAKLDMRALDTDRSALRSTRLPPEKTLLAAELWRNGRGCGGNVLDGQRAVAHERSAISAMLKDGALVVVIGGLGGGTASGGIPVVLSEAAKLHLPTFCVLTLPFLMERPHRIAQAEKALNENIFSAADAVVTLQNDLLLAALPGETPLADAFRLADGEMARTVIALTGILTSGNLFCTSFGDFERLLKRGPSRCAIGVGVARREECGNDCINTALENLLHSPLLGDPQNRTKADAAIITVLGGPELNLQDAKRALELAGKYLPDDAEVIVGAATSEEWRNLLQISLLCVSFDSREEERALLEEPSRLSRGRKKRVDRNGGGDTIQGVFTFDDNRKGVMEGTLPVMWNSEDLDVPTYKRRNLVIIGGKIVRKK